MNLQIKIILINLWFEVHQGSAQVQCPFPGDDAEHGQ